MRRLLPALPGPEVLNAGAGAGSLTLKLVDAGLRVTSTDYSPELCEWTRRALRERGGRGRQPGDAGRPPDASTCPRRPSTPRSARRCSSTSTTTPPPSGELRARAAPRRAAAGHRARRPLPLRLDRPLGGPPAPLHRRGAARPPGRRPASTTSLVQGWGFPLTGLYHRQVYRRALRRRLAAGGGRAAGGAPAAPRRADRARGARGRLGLRRPPPGLPRAPCPRAAACRPGLTRRRAPAPANPWRRRGGLPRRPARAGVPRLGARRRLVGGRRVRLGRSARAAGPRLRGAPAVLPGQRRRLRRDHRPPPPRRAAPRW